MLTGPPPKIHGTRDILLTRELFYTAVTRVRPKVCVVGSEAELVPALAGGQTLTVADPRRDGLREVLATINADHEPDTARSGRAETKLS